MNEKLPSGKQSIVGRRGRPVRDRSCVVIVLSMQSRLLLSPVQITFRHVPDYPDADEIISVEPRDVIGFIVVCEADRKQSFPSQLQIV